MATTDPIMQQSGVSMPGYAMQARQQLADQYDHEVANRLELARFAHEAGLKSTFQNLMKMVGQSRRYAEQARAREQLHAAMMMPGVQAGATSGAPAPAAPQGMMERANQYAGSTWPGLGPAQQVFGQRVRGALGLGAGPTPPASVPHYAMGTCGTNMPQYAEGGLHPGGPALVGEQGPEVVDLPQGARVTPNLLTVIRMLLDMYEQQQGAPDGGGGAMDAGDGGDAQQVPQYAFGTTGSRLPGAQPIGGAPRRAVGPGGAPAGVTGANPLGFIGANGQFNANQGLQDIQLANAAAGNYNPLGNPAVADLARQSILGHMGARQDQAARLADIYAAGDPSFRAYERLKAASDTQSQAAQAYSDAALQQAQSGQNFGRGVYMNQLGAVLRKDPRQPNPLAAIGGQILGAGLGALIPGGGALVPHVTPSPAGDPGAGASYEDPNQLAWTP